MFTKTILAISALAALSSAAPTKANNVARSCSTMYPTAVVQIKEADLLNPAGFSGSSTNGLFSVSTDADQANAVDTVVGKLLEPTLKSINVLIIMLSPVFEGIPHVSQGPCTLYIEVDYSPEFYSSENGQMNVTKIDFGNSAGIVVNDDGSGSEVVSVSFDKPGVGLFGTVGPFPGQANRPAVVNSEACPTDLNGGGNLAFLFSIATNIKEPAFVTFNEGVGANVFLTYGC
jgi:hypothetical protein